MKTAIIHPYARKLRNGNENPKNYPYWDEVVRGLIERGYHVIQVGMTGESGIVEDFRIDLPLKEIKKLVDECHVWIAIDSFFQHLAWCQGKKGIVLFGQSNPDIFGHPENINLYVDRKYFRPDQFATWEECTYNRDAFVDVKKVMSTIDAFV